MIYKVNMLRVQDLSYLKRKIRGSLIELFQSYPNRIAFMPFFVRPSVVVRARAWISFSILWLIWFMF
jgi:hypothetical protein